MKQVPEKQSNAMVVALDEAESYWQPVPANGFVRNILGPATTGSENHFSIGTQTVAPGCLIREHTHDRNEEVIHVLEGEGVARIDGIEHPISCGSTVFIGRNRRHHFINRGDGPLTFLWFFMPGGLDEFFRQIGKPRDPGQTAPEPFPRPDNVAEIEARTVFGWTDASFGPKKG